jgi:putative SOS response-associated peptidase YedK
LLEIGSLVRAKPLDFVEWQPKQDARSGDFMPIITNEFSGILQYFKWGLVPVWAKNIAMGTNMYNTKLENLLEKTALQAIYRYKRCLLPATDFTIRLDAKKKESKTFTAVNNQVFLLCGLWDVWGEGLQSFSILTQKKGAIDIPIIISLTHKDKWLSKRAENLSLLQTIPKLDSFI